MSQTAFTLRWPALNTSDIDHRKFLGYDVSQLGLHLLHVPQVVDKRASLLKRFGVEGITKGSISSSYVLWRAYFTVFCMMSSHGARKATLLAVN